MRRLLLSLASVSLVTGFFATPSASAQQSVNFFVGGFVPTPLDARGSFTGNRSNDVLARDEDVFSFRFDSFKGVTFGGEYLVPLGNFFEAGASIGYYQKTVPAVDKDFVDPQNRNIAANFQLRIVPFNATFRVLPLGHGGFEPYVGGGVGVFGWRYSETGDFVADDNVTIIHGNFVGSGSATGPVVVGGLRVPLGSWSIGGELKYQSAVGELPSNQGFATAPGSSVAKIDLGGLTYSFTFGVRF